MNNSGRINNPFVHSDIAPKSLLCDGLDGIKVDRVKPLPSRGWIKMKPEFYERSAADQFTWMHSFASSMNDALRIMQSERNQVIKICAKQEAQLKQNATRHTQLTQGMQNQMVSKNVDAHARAQELLDAKAEIRSLRAEVAALTLAAKAG